MKFNCGITLIDGATTFWLITQFVYTIDQNRDKNSTMHTEIDMDK